jgi:hypothetical protein
MNFSCRWGGQRGWCDGVGDGAMGSGTVTGVGDDDGGTAGGVKAEGGVGNGVGAMGSGMVRWVKDGDGVGDDDEGTTGDVEAEGGVGNGVGTTVRRRGRR